MADTLLRCEKCDNEKSVSFSDCLAHGWPKCCGLTMTMQSTSANMDEAVCKIIKEPMEMIKQYKLEQNFSNFIQILKKQETFR